MSLHIRPAVAADAEPCGRVIYAALGFEVKETPDDLETLLLTLMARGWYQEPRGPYVPSGFY